MSTTDVSPALPADVSSSVYEGDYIYITLSDEDESEVLELVKSNEDGMFIRENQQWIEIDPDADDERVWNRTIVDLTKSAVPVFDQAEAAGDVTSDLFDEYEIA